MLDLSFNQQSNVGNNTWNTGCFRRKLESIISGNKPEYRCHPKSIARARHILEEREHSGKVPKSITSNEPAYTFEQQLDYHIHESIIFASTGVSASFFAHPSYHDFMRRVDPRHRPVYRLKLVRLVRCVIDVMQNEVRELYLYLCI